VKCENADNVSIASKLHKVTYDKLLSDNCQPQHSNNSPIFICTLVNITAKF